MLDRRRVYVLPTRFGFFYMALALTMCIGALNYNNNPALLLGLSLIGAGLASLLYAHLQLSGLRADSIGAEPVPAGEPLQLRIACSVRDARPRAGLRVAVGAASATLSVPASGGGIACLPLPTRRRGWQETGRIEVSSIRPLGLARAWSWIRPEEPLLVHPTPEAEAPPLPDVALAGTRSRPHFTGEDLHLLRDYQPGDPMRTIAWKPSARHGQLMSRTWEHPHGDEIAFDWHALALPHEARIRRLARWVDMAEREGRRYALQLPMQPLIGPGNGHDHLHACLRALALMPEAHGH